MVKLKEVYKYIKKGMVVVPEINKIPFIDNWTTDINHDNCKDFIDGKIKYFNKSSGKTKRVIFDEKNHNIACLVGNDKIIVLDLDILKSVKIGEQNPDDPRYKISGLDWWKEILKKYKVEEPQTVKVITGSGGVHLYFKLGDYNKKVNKIYKYSDGIKYKGKIAKVDILTHQTHGENFKVTMPPSKHESGNLYKWERDPFKFVILPMPEWLINELYNLPEQKAIRDKIKRDEKWKIEAALREKHKYSTDFEFKDGEEIALKKVDISLSCLDIESRWDPTTKWKSIKKLVMSIWQLYNPYGSIHDSYSLFFNFEKYAKQSTNYKPYDDFNENEKYCMDPDINKHLKIWHDLFEQEPWEHPLPILISYAKKDNIDLYIEKISEIDVMDKKIIDNIFNGELGHSEIINQIYSDEIYMVNKKIYMWNYKTCLWEESERDKIILKISKTLYSYINKYYIYVNCQIKKYNELIKKSKEEKEEKEENEEDEDVDDKENDENKNNLYKYKCENKSLFKIIKIVQNQRHGNAVFKYICASIEKNELKDKLDKISHLIPIKNNKVIDLRNGEILNREKEHYFTFEQPFTYGNPNNPEVIEIFNEITCYNIDKSKFLQTAIGFSLTGEPNNRTLFILYGKDGNNGKTTIVKIIRKLSGRYHIAAAKEIFVKDRSMNRHSGASTPHLVPLMNSRVATHSETEKRDQLNIALLKSITGEDPIYIKPLYENGTDVDEILAKLWLITNKKPIIPIKDKALLDRIRYIKMDAEFLEKDKLDPEKVKEKKQFLKDKKKIKRLFEENLDDLFAYFVQGAIRYYKEGLKTPDCILQEKDQYLSKLDPLKKFLETQIIVSAADTIKIPTLKNEYNKWAFEDYKEKMTSNAILKYLREKKELYQIDSSTNGNKLIGFKFIENGKVFL